MIKQDERFGFDCLLFERCNLNCDFCLESHLNSNIDYEWINKLPFLLLERFKNEFRETITEVTFRFWGGELFYDALDDDLFETYRNMIFTINDLFKNKFPNINVKHSWVTNGVYNNIDRVINLLKDTNSLVSVSYDPVGRYKTKEQEQLMLKNTKIFYENSLLDEISITLTKLNIEAYIQGKSIIKDLQFCKKFDINYYIPNINWKTLMPNDDDLYNFFKWVVDEKLFSIIDVSRVLRTIFYNSDNVEKVCNCENHISACKNCLTYNCVTSSTIFPNSDFYGDKEINEENVAKIKKHLGLLKRGCMFCEYSGKCPKGCHTSILYKNYVVTECPYKRLYKYIEDNPNVLENFSVWDSLKNTNK